MKNKIITFLFFFGLSFAISLFLLVGQTSNSEGTVIPDIRKPELNLNVDDSDKVFCARSRVGLDYMLLNFQEIVRDIQIRNNIVFVYTENPRDKTRTQFYLLYSDNVTKLCFLNNGFEVTD